MLSDDLIYNILEIKQGNLIVIAINDIKKRRWIADSCFDLSDDDDFFGKPGFEKAMKKIEKPNGFVSKFIKSKKQHEIYDWNTYQCVMK